MSCVQREPGPVGTIAARREPRPVTRAAIRLFASERGALVLAASLAMGLVLRLAILWFTRSLGTEIVDEQHYTQLARSLLAGDGLAWRPGVLTSIRPPFYPGLLAAIWSIVGSDSLQQVRVVQIILALATAGVVYALGTRLYGRTVGQYAAAASFLYPSLIFFNFLILTETLFTLLLLLFVLLSVMTVQHQRASLAVLCGITLGLAALTRSVLWPLPVVLSPLMVVLLRGPLVKRLALAATLLVGYALVVAPWAIRNTKLQGVTTIVDTMGGMNLRMGNYEYTPEDRMWDAVNLTGPQNWGWAIHDDYPNVVLTEGQKDRWAQRRAIVYMIGHPLVTVRRSLIRFADLWGIEREFVAGIQDHLIDTPGPVAVLVSFLIVAVYLATAVAGAAGVWMTPPADRRANVLLLLPVIAIVAAHTLTFGHSRYHLPLIPILLLYGTALVVEWRTKPPIHPIRVAAAAATIAVLVSIWVRQIVLVDADRIRALLDHVV